MSGVFFGIFAGAILVVIWWYVQNERIGPDSDGDKGLLAMRTHAKAAKRTSPNASPQVNRARRVP
jgi:hypothetical protein